SQLNYCLSHRLRDFVPDTSRRRLAIFQGPGAARQIALVPDVEGGARDAEWGQGAPHRQRRLLDQPDDLQLLGGRVSHISDSPSPSTLFFRRRFSTISSASSS